MTCSPKTDTRTIRLPVGGITISLERENSQQKPGAGSISSDLKESDDDLYNAAIDGLESLILAHACAGIDVRSPAYLEGVETAIDAVANNIEESDTRASDIMNLQTQHAPGPWRVQVFQDRRGRSITKVIADDCHICTVDYTAARTALGQLCPEYLDGNARLIAEAPALLHSLQSLVDQAERIEALDQDRNVLPGCYQRALHRAATVARAAIYKVTGK